MIGKKKRKEKRLDEGVSEPSFYFCEICTSTTEEVTVMVDAALVVPFIGKENLALAQIFSSKSLFAVNARIG